MVKRLGLFIVASLLSVGCGELVSEERAVSAARDEGYTNIRVTAQHGISPRFVGGCGKDDSVAFEVTGTNSQHRQVEFTVCCGLILKGCTLRH